MIKSSGWKFLKQVDGNEAVSLPAGWSEVHIEAGTVDSYGIIYTQEVTATRQGMPSGGKYYYTGEYRDSGRNSQRIFLVTPGTARCAYAFSGGNDSISEIKTYVWYK